MLSTQSRASCNRKVEAQGRCEATRAERLFPHSPEFPRDLRLGSRSCVRFRNPLPGAPPTALHPGAESGANGWCQPSEPFAFNGEIDHSRPSPDIRPSEPAPLTQSAGRSSVQISGTRKTVVHPLSHSGSDWHRPDSAETSHSRPCPGRRRFDTFRAFASYDRGTFPVIILSSDASDTRKGDYRHQPL